MTDGWYFARDGQQVGPLSRGQLVAELRRSPFWQQEFIWKQGYATWLEAGSVDELLAELIRPRPERDVLPFEQRGGGASIRVILLAYAGCAMLGVVGALIYFWLF